MDDFKKGLLEKITPELVNTIRGQLSKRSSPVKVVIKNGQCPGDGVSVAHAINSLHYTYPGCFLTDTRTPYKPIFEGNPNITDIQESEADKVIDLGYETVHLSNQSPFKFFNGCTNQLSKELNIPIIPAEYQPCIYIREEEKGWFSAVREILGRDVPYWIIDAGYKKDYTAKHWGTSNYQAVVDALPNVHFVQIGAKDEGHFHPRLRGKNVVDMIGKTDLRQFIRLVYNAYGVITPVSFPQLLAFAIEPHPRFNRKSRASIVIAGGREPNHWQQGPNQQYLHTCGMLSCCDSGGCWKSRIRKLEDGDKEKNDSLCLFPVRNDENEIIPLCMSMIKPQQVIEKVENYMFGLTMNTNTEIFRKKAFDEGFQKDIDKRREQNKAARKARKKKEVDIDELDLGDIVANAVEESNLVEQEQPEDEPVESGFVETGEIIRIADIGGKSEEEEPVKNRDSIFVSSNKNYVPYLNAFLNSLHSVDLTDRVNFDVNIIASDDFPEGYVEKANSVFGFKVNQLTIDPDETGLPNNMSLSNKCKASRYYYTKELGKDYDVTCLMDADLFVVSRNFANFFDLVRGTRLLFGCNEKFKWVIDPNTHKFEDGSPVIPEKKKLYKFHCNTPLFLDVKNWQDVFDYYLRVVYQANEYRGDTTKEIGDIFAWNIAVARCGRENDVIYMPMETMTQVHQTGGRDWVGVTKEGSVWHTTAGDEVYSLHARPDKPGWRLTQEALDKNGINKARYESYARLVEQEWYRLNFEYALPLTDFFDMKDVWRSLK